MGKTRLGLMRREQRKIFDLAETPTPAPRQGFSWQPQTVTSISRGFSEDQRQDDQCSWGEDGAMEKAFYEIVDHTADVGIRVQGRDLAEVFEKAALAFYDLMVGLDAVERRQRREVSVEAEALDEVLVQWLDELLYLFDVEGFLGKALRVALSPSWGLTATVYGETFDPDRHRVKLLYKAVTYHKASVAFADGMWWAQVIFDI